MRHTPAAGLVPGVLDVSWSLDETELLRFLVKIENKSASEVAAIVRKSRNAVIGKVDRMGWQFAGSTKQRQVKGGRPRKPRPVTEAPEAPPRVAPAQPRKFSWE